MLCCLKEELYKSILPTLEKAKDYHSNWDKEKAEALVITINEKLNNSVDSSRITQWYLQSNTLRADVREFMESHDPYVSEFGHKVEWLLVRGPHFYTDD